jgi:hypothetical protein
MKKIALTLSICAMLIFAPSANALYFALTSDHCTGGCGTAPYGYVQLVQDGTSVDVTVHLYSPNYFVKTGAADDQAFKFNASGVLLGDITVDQTVPGQTLAADAGAFNGDGTGPFGFGIICTTCGGGASDKFNNDITFTVASATIADLTALNGPGGLSGNIFVADIIGSTGNTGPVDASERGTDVPPPQVPEPGTMLLLGFALVGLAGVRRFKK